MKALIYFYSILFINSIIAEEELPVVIERSDIGIDELIKIASKQFPIPSVTPVGETIVQYTDYSTCSNDSVIQDMVMNVSYPIKYTCNGQQAYLYNAPFIYDIKMRANGETSRLIIFSSTFLVKYLNGNLIMTGSGTIDAPVQCKGDYFYELVMMAPNDRHQYQCLSTGVTGHTMVYSLKQVVGKCESMCWHLTANTRLDPTVNNLGLVNKH